MCDNYYPMKKKRKNKSKIETMESMSSRKSSNKTNSWWRLCYSPADINESTMLELLWACELLSKLQPSPFGYHVDEF